MIYQITDLKKQPYLFEAQDKICVAAWPEFMLQDPLGNQYWMEFIKAFLELQRIFMQNNRIIAVVNAVALNYDQALDYLPEEGWDWGLEKSILDFRAGKKANTVMGIQIVIAADFLGYGISKLAITELVNRTKELGYQNLIIPARPSFKHLYPLIDIDDYLSWKNDESLPFDPWLRIHVRLGGKILKSCKSVFPAV